MKRYVKVTTGFQMVEGISPSYGEFVPLFRLMIKVTVYDDSHAWDSSTILIKHLITELV